MTSRDSNELSAAAGFSAAAEGSNAWMKTERGQGDADITRKAMHKPSTPSGGEKSDQQALGHGENELGQGHRVMGHGDGAQSPPIVEAILHTVIEPMKQQFTEELAQRDVRIQQLEEKIERLGGADIDLAANSNLNVKAQEFVPRYNFQGFEPAPVLVAMPEPVQVVNTACILHPLDEMQQSITYLTDRPGQFDLMMSPLMDSLSLSMHDESTMLEIIEMILAQAISEPNFRYTGARMCNFLSQNLTTALGAGNFRQQLLKRCHKEFEKSMQLIENNNICGEVTGFALFLAELLSNVMDSSNERLKILAYALGNLLTSLLGDSSDPALRCVVQVLKLSGGILHDIESQLTGGGVTPQLDQIFDLLKQVLVTSQCSRNMKAMLLSVIELRASDWGRESGDPPGGSTQATNNALPYSNQVEPVYDPLVAIDSYPEWYTGDVESPDGLVEMADGIFVYDDEDDYEVEADAHGMDDEMTEAYEMFMQQQQNKLQQ